MEQWIEIAIANPGFAVGVVVIGLLMIFFIPFIWFLIKNFKDFIIDFKETNNKGFERITNALDTQLGNFYLTFKEHASEDNENFKAIQKEISKAVGKTKLDNIQLIEIARARVWLTSEKKLDFIKKRLEKNNLSERGDIIKKQIRTELERRSEEYIDFLNQFITEVGLLGDWINDNFPMNDFINEVFDVVFRPKAEHMTDRECISQKIDDIRFIMSSYQNALWQKLKGELL